MIKRFLRVNMLFIIIGIIVFSYGTHIFAIASDEESSVFLAGFPINLEIFNNGPIVCSVSDVLTSGDRLKKGDVIKEINGQAVTCSEDIVQIMSSASLRVPLKIKVLRSQSECILRYVPEIEECSGKLKLGVKLKECVTGLGTVTCAIGENFYALGHPVTDGETGVTLDCRLGSVYKCSLTGIKRPSAEAPGRLIGRCVNSQKPIGSITNNSATGLKGVFNKQPEGMKAYKTMPREKVHAGGAQIYTTIGKTAQFYNIEIVKTNYQSTPSEKSMVIKVSDEKLLSLTGGILQGMSGSPILQDGKLAGAVTHVFTNDPTRGYGIYFDWLVA